MSSYANDPERIEEQANRMAKEGWILEKFGSLFSTYRRGKAGEYEYRVQVKEAGMDRLVYTAELAEFGIEEVGGVGDLLVLRKKADGTPFDLYSDLDSLIAQQKKAVRYLRTGLIMSFFWGSMMLMNVLTTLMNANVIGWYAGKAAINFSTAKVLMLVAASLLLLSASWVLSIARAACAARNGRSRRSRPSASCGSKASCKMPRRVVE